MPRGSQFGSGLLTPSGSAIPGVADGDPRVLGRVYHTLTGC